MAQIEPLPDSLGSQQFSIPDNRTSPMVNFPANPGSPQVSTPNKPATQMFSISNSLGSQTFPVTNMRTTQTQHMPTKLKQFPAPNMRMTPAQPMPTKLGQFPSPAPSMRMTQAQPIPTKLGQFHSPTPSMRMTQAQPIPTKLEQFPAPGMRMTQAQPMPSKLKPQQLPMVNKRNAPMAPSPKSQAESFESVRAKLRESLAGSLELVSKDQTKVAENNSQNEAEDPSKLSNEDNNLAESTSTTNDINLPSNDLDSAQKVNDNHIPPWETQANVNTGDGTQTYNCDGLNYVLLDEDVPFSNFLIKDDLLQGNGLCWAPDIVVEVAQEDEHIAKKSKLVHGEGKDDRGKEVLQSPQALATRIEAELFKLFGGVNKKYKEKGRSLMFNLKDRSNPELRERVMSGELSPDRLCSMTAEELASKELSEWRIAKAEELGKMVVLPDVDLDVRRFVRKTHKGEFQVIEYEKDDSVSVEVSLGESSLPQFIPKTSEKEATVSSKPETEASKVVSNDKVSLEDELLDSTFSTLPNDGSDLMQGLVMDELKDAEFLPPIISLDEFMESLDAEPPFENLTDDCGHTLTTSDEKSSDVITESGTAGLGSIDPLHVIVDKSEDAEVKFTTTEALDKPEVTEVKNTKLDDLDIKEVNHSRTDSEVKSNSTRIDLEASPVDGDLKIDSIWEGLLQLNVSSMVTVNGYFKSGEKTSVKDWPSFLDIKGRVRRDPFEKFLQELPLSRSRAVMVLHFCWKEGSPESGRANILETADSYVADERVGFAEPAPGVELYLCPPHNKIVDMLVKHLSKSHTETLNSIDNGLIGIVVWRKAHVSSKKQNQSSLRRHQEKNSHANASVRTPPERPPAPPVSEPIDDIPPGFGPSASKDEDDLPEFDFVGGGSNPSGQGFSTQKLEARAPPPPRPVEQMRNLISKYGRGEMSSNGGVGVEIQPWNDDDDIPEWQPQMPSQQQQMPMPQPSLPLPPPPPPQPQAQLQSYSQQQNFAPPMPQPQMVTQQYYMPMQQHQLLPQQMVQHQIPNMIQGGQQVMVSSWPAQGATWTYQFGPNGLIMQPCNNYNGQQQQQPYVGQYYGTQNGQINNTIWRPN